jgi:phosphotriesterase-related protein
LSRIQTVLGEIDSKDIGLTLPHEHLFYDLRGPLRPQGAHIDRQEVVKVVLPSLLSLKEKGVATLIECSTGGIGRDHLLLRDLAMRSHLNVVAPTGFYKEYFMPPWVRGKTVDQLADWMYEEIQRGMDGTSVRAGFIKLAATSEGLTALEEKVLRAAARASQRTAAAIADHTESGAILLQEVNVLRDEGFDLRKFIWVHAHAEPDIPQHIRAADIGINIEYDAIGGDKPDEFFMDLVKRLASEGHEDKILLSQDAGGYNAAEPGGGKPRDLGYIVDRFIPNMETKGMKELIPLVMVENPRRVFQLR